MPTRHPCAGRSATAIRAFETIAIGEQPPVSPRTLAALAKAGLIEQIGEEVIHRDRFGEVRIPVYQVPLPIHYQWCRWAAEHADENE